MSLEVYKPKEGSKIKALIYGPPGAGKTTLAASAHAHKSMGPVLFCNVEGGTMAITDPATYGAKTIPDVVDFKSFAELDKVFLHLLKNPGVYNTLVIDSVSELQKFNVDAIVQAKIDKGGKNRDEDDIFLEDYGTSAKQMRRVLRKFRDLPMHVILTCHDMPYSKEDNAPIGPALTPALRGSVLGYMDIVGYMFTDSEKDAATKETVITHKLLTRPAGRWVAKDRSPGMRLGTIITNPTFSIIHDRALGIK